jgi:hypothetical protein
MKWILSAQSDHKKLGVVEKLSSGSEQGQVVDPCGHVNEYSSSIIFK